MGWWGTDVMGGDTPLGWRDAIFHMARGLTRETLNRRLPYIVKVLEGDRRCKKGTCFFHLV